MKKISQLMLSLVFYSLTGVGISLTIKAGIGVSSFNSLNVALSNALQMKIGMITTILNGGFLLAYILLSKFRHPAKYLTQAVAAICLGTVIDFFTYQVLGNVTVTGYWGNLLTFILGTSIAGVATGMVLNLEVMAFPIESACMEFAQKTRLPFSRVRYGVDLLCVSVSLILSLLLGLPIFVREGTVISLFLLTAAISFTKKLFEKAIHKKVSSK